MTSKPTSLDEIRAQSQPYLLELPGFKPGTSINVIVRPIDITSTLLEAGISNPLMGRVMEKVRQGHSKEDIAEDIAADAENKGSALASMVPMLEQVARDALVEPTYEEITTITPLTLAQQLKILEAVSGDDTMSSFRDESRLRSVSDNGNEVEGSSINISTSLVGTPEVPSG